MTPGRTDLLAVQDRVLEHTGRIVAGVGPEQLEWPTPCSAWDVAELIAHLADGNEMFASAAGGAPAAGGDGDPHEGGGRAGVVARYHRSAAALRAAWRRPGALEGRATLPFGVVPAAMAVEMHSVDHFVHGWDLARATGQPTGLDPELAEFAYRSVTAAVGDDARGPDGPFAAEVPCPADAPVQARLLAFLGRQP